MSNENGNGLLEQWRERTASTDIEALKESNDAKEVYQAGMEALFMSFFKDNQELVEFSLDLWGTLTRVCNPKDSAKMLDDYRLVLASGLVHRIFGDDINVVVVDAPQ